jgi:hypothetical protein
MPQCTPTQHKNKGEKKEVEKNINETLSGSPYLLANIFKHQSWGYQAYFSTD